MTKIYPNNEYRHIYSEIIRENVRRERRRLSKWATPSLKASRRHKEDLPDRANIRPPFFHDTDRIIHCNAYARYRDKTQVFFRTANDHITRRFLHVQIVAKISRTLARFLRANEDLTEAIALAHDLGHAPFGHAGEEVIADILEEKGAGSFVHNAQSVRLLDILENNGKGLNLTLQVLDGVLGHNGELPKKELKFERKNLTWKKLDKNVSHCLSEKRMVKPEKGIIPSTLEGCIVRISDIFAYLGRDIEDAIELKIIKRKELPRDAVEILGDRNADIINNLAMDITHNSYDKDHLEFSDEVFEAMNKLIKFNRERIYNADFVKKQESKFRKIVRELFDACLDELNNKDEESVIYKHYFRDMTEDYRLKTSPPRVVADFLSGMTDNFLIDEYHKKFMPEKIGYYLKG